MNSILELSSEQEEEIIEGECELCRGEGRIQCEACNGQLRFSSSPKFFSQLMKLEKYLNFNKVKVSIQKLSLKTPHTVV